MLKYIDEVLEPNKGDAHVNHGTTVFYREIRAIYRSMHHNTSKKMKESTLKAFNLVRSKTMCSYFSQCELTLKHR